MCFCFFFFKQNTAYEWRISDWSSDVCSSDLRIRDPQPLYGRYDAAGRFLFSAWMLYALLHGASAVLWVFLFFEVVWGLVQVLPVRASSRASLAPTRSLRICGSKDRKSTRLNSSH